MATNRIQKLLFSEYSDMEDVVLVESPFAETDRTGEGIRQVQIGLTPSKLILAEYKMPLLEEETHLDHQSQDPDIESFELVSAYPVECVNLSVFRHRRRQTIKARFSNGRLCYYELGGWHERKMLWSLWCERIQFLAPYEATTSASETSVATGSSGSSLFIVRSTLSVSKNGQPTLWCHYASSDKVSPPPGCWSDPHLYLGPLHIEKGVNYKSLPEISNASRNRKLSPKKHNTKSIKENLVLSAQHELMAQQAVDLWESQHPLVRKVHRRHEICPFPGLLAGLGLWRFSKQQAFTLQCKRHASSLHLPQTSEDCQLVVPVAQLTRTVSLESLEVPSLGPDKLIRLSQHRPQPKCLEFWTSKQQMYLEWQRKQYSRQQRYLNALRKRSGTLKKDPRQRKKKRTKSTNQTPTPRTITLNEGVQSECHGDQGGGDYKSIYSVSWQCPDRKSWMKQGSKRFTSSDLAHQLTMIDRHLFLQIDILDLERLRKDMSSWRAPHLGVLLSFSFRVSCLVASQILTCSDVKERAVLIARFIGVAYKCHRLHSLQSAVSVLQGLHSPAVYRLHLTWAYVRRHFTSKYRRLGDLSRRYQDPRLPLYLKTFDNLSKIPPYIPPVGLLVAVLLQRLPQLPAITSPECTSANLPRPVDPKTTTPLRRFLSTLHIYPQPSSLTDNTACQPDTQLHTVPQEILQDKFSIPVSHNPTRRVVQDLHYFLEACQSAATRYGIPINQQVRTFLLQSPYNDPCQLIAISKELEP